MLMVQFYRKSPAKAIIGWRAKGDENRENNQ
jgi:hypothetical protein